MPMLRACTLRRVACVLTFALVCAAAQDAFAGGNVQGTSCPASGISTGIGTGAVTDANNLVCLSGTWQYPVYVLQSAAAAAGSSCSSYPAGAMRYNTTLTNTEFCNGTTWEQVPSYPSSCGTPSGLSFTALTSQSLSTVVTSNTPTITFSGCTSALTASVSGVSTAQISVNGGSWAASGAISSGQTLQVRLTTSNSANTALTATVLVGTTSANWSVTTVAGALKVFGTASTYVGTSIGDLAGADALCVSNASSAGYSGGPTGTWKAIMSDASTSAHSRLTLTYPIVNAYDGTTVAGTNLWDGTITTAIKSPSGSTSGVAWTGSAGDGTISSGGTCSSWSSSGGLGELGIAADLTGSLWTAENNAVCSNNLDLYCIQQ
jgi:hypothetical protein